MIMFAITLAGLVASKFESDSINRVIAWARATLKPAVAQMFEQCYPNSANTTIFELDSEQTYVITGDIEAMWLRDSCNQVLPYLLSNGSADTSVSRMITNLVRSQARYIMLEPYANAYLNVTKRKAFKDKSTRLLFGTQLVVDQDLVWERKWEVDSLAYFLRLANEAWSQLGLRLDADLIRAFRTIFNVIYQQLDDKTRQQQSLPLFYTFEREGHPAELDHQGMGAPGCYSGLVRSGFRPSDDAAKMPYNVPGNVLLSGQLDKLANGLLKQQQSPVVVKLRQTASQFSSLIKRALSRFSTQQTKFGVIFVQEVDGCGSYVTGDDPNLPSLMQLPLLNYTSSDSPYFRSTKDFLYSKSNEYFYVSKDSSVNGIGSSHTPRQFIWPIGIMTRIGVSTDPAEIIYGLTLLKMQGDLMHQSFDVNSPKNHTRDWFAWANSMLAETVLHLSRGPFNATVLREQQIA